MPRLTYETIRRMTPEALGKLSKEQSKDLLRQFRQKYQVRAEQLERWEGRVYSYAKDKMDDYYANAKNTNIETMSRNQLQNELFQIQAFFNSETSSVQGAKRVAREQDVRIFGETGNRAKHRMSVEDRRKFWALYEEFLNQNPTATTAYTSGKIQQYIGQMIKDKSKLDSLVTEDEKGNLTFNTEGMEELRGGMRSYEKSGTSRPNVYSGRGNTSDL